MKIRFAGQKPFRTGLVRTFDIDLYLELSIRFLENLVCRTSKPIKLEYHSQFTRFSLTDPSPRTSHFSENQKTILVDMLYFHTTPMFSEKSYYPWGFSI